MPRLRLEPALTIREVTAVREAWLQALAADPGPVTVELTSGATFDTAGGQLLLALRGECQLQGRVCRWEGAAEGWEDLAMKLGLPSD